MGADGWQGLYRGNLVNVICVAPSKGIVLFVFDIVNKYLTRPGEELKIPIPASSITGALAGVSSTFVYIPSGAVKNTILSREECTRSFSMPFSNIVKERGSLELYRGLTPILIAVYRTP